MNKPYTGYGLSGLLIIEYCNTAVWWGNEYGKSGPLSIFKHVGPIDAVHIFQGLILTPYQRHW